MQKLILRCGLSAGDIIMLTSAIRDLHHCYPGKFQTDVRTFFPDIWENNPYLTPLSENDPEITQLDCSYPLINRCNELPHHCLDGFIDFLNQRVGLKLRLTARKGDIHLSDLERSWYSQVHELTRRDIPFWIVAAGGKYDVTIKWWATRRYQQVVDHFKGRVQFVQVGARGHHHPKLEGTIDLRGQTTFRELIRLVYHADGVLCPVTALMHLAAAVESRHGPKFRRACVVLAGGREPVHWEAYPGHQFLHTIGALDCCRTAGCWKDRAVPLRDSDRRDRLDCRCINLAGELPRCMDMISAEEVIRQIGSHYAAGHLRPLTLGQRDAAHKAVRTTQSNPYDRQPLNLHNAGTECERFIPTIPEYPRDRFRGRGIVICGGGSKYFPSTWVCIRMLRRARCRLPIELWHLGQKEVNVGMRALLAQHGVRCIDALRLRRRYPARRLGGWELKSYAILHSRFEEVLFLDADNVAVENPEYLFDTPQFRKTGAVFWPDYNRCGNPKARAVWRSCGLRQPREQEFETGQILVDKAKCWRALCLSRWFNDHSDLYYRHVHGDKETFHLAFQKLRQRYVLVPTPIHALDRTMCQHDLEGRRIFQHRNRDKWDYLLCNRAIKDFWFEQECRNYVLELGQLWDGGCGGFQNRPVRRRLRGLPGIRAVMISCLERSALRQQTLSNLAKTDWADIPLHVQMDTSDSEDHQQRQTQCAYLALHSALGTADYVLFLEDDLDFNRHLRHNLFRWRPLRDQAVTLGSLYNPGLRELACDGEGRSRIIAPHTVYGSQAFLISNETLKYILARWNRVPGMQDIKISRLAGRLGSPLRYHAPSLVQHMGRISASAGHFHVAADFDPEWKAS